MKDFTRTLQGYCVANDISYHYGRKASLNLLQSDTLEDKIYMLHEASPRRANMNTTKTNIESFTFIGKFFLMVKSTIDMPYFNEKQVNDSTSKYTTNIEPLLNLFQSIGNSFGCTDFEVEQWEAIDVVNVFDANKDGILVTYTVKGYDV